MRHILGINIPRSIRNSPVEMLSHAKRVYSAYDKNFFNEDNEDNDRDYVEEDGGMWGPSGDLELESDDIPWNARISVQAARMVSLERKKQTKNWAIERERVRQKEMNWAEKMTRTMMEKQNRTRNEDESNSEEEAKV